MDTGKGYMEACEDEADLEKKMKENPDYRGVFRQGEVLEIRGSKFLIKQITKYQMTLSVFE